jgi:hypothetical protein
MRRKVTVFFPQNLFPPKSGFHKRGLEIIGGLKEIGCEVTILSSVSTADPEWNSSSIRELKAKLVKDIFIYEPQFLDHKYIEIFERYYKYVNKRPAFNSKLNCPPGMKRWFTQMVQDVSPDAIIMNYAYWDGLIDHRQFNSTCRIIETIDLLTLNLQMWETLQSDLPPMPISLADTKDAMLQEDYYEKLNLSVLPQEFRIYDKYQYTVAISQQEANLIEQNTKKTNVIHIPMTHKTHQISNSYTGPALFPTGPNPFNIQGYLYFVKRVLPLIQKHTSSFRLQVTGYCNDTRVRSEPGVVLSGFVPNLEAVYQSARFVVCPIFGGTGQQVKIVEAMAHGLTVIALRVTAERSPIEHGVNGLVANDAEEFAEHVVRLWNDPELCRQLGRAARDKISRDFSEAQLVNSLSSIMNADLCTKVF